VAVFTKRDTDVLPVLLHMVSVAGALLVADNAPHFFDKPQVGFLFGGKFIQHSLTNHRTCSFFLCFVSVQELVDFVVHEDQKQFFREVELCGQHDV